MSVDPSAVASAAAGASAALSSAAVEALIAAELNALAADAQALQSMVTTGQVVTAQVLPPNGMTDLINVLGNRVAAALPPTLSPGDVFTAQVTGFNGPQILLQIITTVDPAQLAPDGQGSPVPLPPETAAPLEAAVTRPASPAEVTPSVAPPPAVFVAASVRPATLPGAPATAGPPPSALPNQAPPPVLADIEARMAAARAGAISVNVPPPAPPPSLSAPPSAAPAPPPAAGAPPPPAPLPSAAPGQPAAAAPPPPPPARFSFPPPIVPSARFGEPAPAATPASSNAPAAPAAPSPALYRDPVVLVRALGLPNTPTNVAAAKLALTSPQRLPAALATLESALPQSDDPRVATLRTLTTWLGKLDPASPQLAAQISSYVDNVVTGNEPKLAQLLFAQFVSDQPEAPPPAVAAPGEPAPAPGADAPVPIPQSPALPVVALAQAAERGIALTADLKTQLLSLINSPPAGGAPSDDLLPAASTALSAVTAVQLNAAQAMNASPQTIAFTLPMWLGSGYAQARVAIDRDAPEPGGKRGLDGDNFHIAFVLDTKNLGIVTVDLQTVGRAFSLAVKTENEQTAQRFGDSLKLLTDRLETLRYRVNSAEATVAPRGSAATTGTVPVTAGESVEGDGIASDVNVRA